MPPPNTHADSPGRPSGRRRVRLLLRASAVLLGLLLGAGLAEGALRAFAPFPWYPWTSVTFPADDYHPRYGWSGVPRLDTTYTLREFRVAVRHNADGFREESVAAKLSAAGSKRRVLFLGDSFGWGWGVDRHERVSEQLVALDPTLVAVNQSQSGFATDQELLVLQDHGPDVQPDVVVVLMHSNDFLSVGSDVEYGQPKPRFVVRDGELQLTNVPVPRLERAWQEKRRLAEIEALMDPGYEWLSKSHLFNWARSATLERPPVVAPAPEAEWSRNAEVMTALFQALRAECETYMARLLIVLIPTAEQLTGATSPDDWQRDVDAACTDAGIDCLDLLPALAGQSGVHFRLDRHWTAHGHRLAAKALHAALSETAPPRPGASEEQ